MKLSCQGVEKDECQKRVCSAFLYSLSFDSVWIHIRSVLKEGHFFTLLTNINAHLY